MIVFDDHIRKLLKIEEETKREFYLQNFVNNDCVEDSRPKIILIDDNEIINNTHKKILESILLERICDYDIILGSDGLELIQIALNLDNDYEKIEFILTDENMDYLKGSEAIKFIRKFEKIKNFKNVKVISLTSYEDNKIFEYIKKNGGDYVLTKPVSKTSLIQALEQIGF